jgi:hypothetical protein
VLARRLRAAVTVSSTQRSNQYDCSQLDRLSPGEPDSCLAHPWLCMEATGMVKPTLGSCSSWEGTMLCVRRHASHISDAEYLEIWHTSPAEQVRTVTGRTQRSKQNAHLSVSSSAVLGSLSSAIDWRLSKAAPPLAAAAPPATGSTCSTDRGGEGAVYSEDAVGIRSGAHPATRPRGMKALAILRTAAPAV